VKFARRFFFVIITMSLMTEALPYAGDGVAQIGWYLHTDLKKWVPIGVPFTVIELSLIVCLLCWLLRGGAARKRFGYIPGRLLVPIIVFGVAVAIGTFWGAIRAGHGFIPSIYALFEIRDFGIMICAYFLVGMLVRDERDLSTLVWCMLIACTGLAIENTLRYYLLLRAVGVSDLNYDHPDSAVLAFGVVLSVALITFRGTPWQRRVAFVLVPLSLLCMAVMHRRAAFGILPFGLIALAIIVYRLRPKQFWRYVPIIALLLSVYLVAYWNNTGTLGQPARAIRSQFQPDPRDASSNLYRDIEHADIIANIRSSRIMGLGFGQQFTFYYPLPDLSFWQFWHYTPHNAVLWVWMDGGVACGFAFFWLLGSGTYFGSRELAARREAWSLTQLPLMRRRKRPRAAAPSQAGSASALLLPSAAPWGHADASRAEARAEARAEKGTKLPLSPYSGSAIALIAAGVCQIAIQLTFSYVDLGLTDDRLMLLLGVVLGVMGRTYISAPVRQRRRPGRSRASRPAAPDRAPSPRLENGSEAGGTDKAGVVVGGRAPRVSTRSQRGGNPIIHVPTYSET
jgi:hypothetical protein